MKKYVEAQDSKELKLNFWQGFYLTNSQMLKNVIAQSNDYLKYFETIDKEKVIEFGAELKTIPQRCFIDDDGIETIEDKVPARFCIRQDFHGNIQFIAISPYFKENDNLKKTIKLIEPVSPKVFDYNELPNILIEFLKFVTEWESSVIGI